MHHKNCVYIPSPLISIARMSLNSHEKSQMEMLQVIIVTNSNNN